MTHRKPPVHSLNVSTETGASNGHNPRHSQLSTSVHGSALNQAAPMVDEQRPCCQCGEQRREIDFRLAGATNRDLKQLVRSGEFRRQEMLV